MLGILSLFALNTQPLDIVCCFSMNFCRSNNLCDCHKLMVAITRLVNLNCGNIKAGDKNAEVFLQTFTNVMFNRAVDLCGFAFNLNDRYTVFGRGIRYAVFHISAGSVTNLLLEIIKTETAESMQLDKSSVIRNAETDRPSHGNRDSKIRKPWIIYIKERDTEFYLNNLGKVDKINLRLKRCATIIG